MDKKPHWPHPLCLPSKLHLNDMRVALLDSLTKCAIQHLYVAIYDTFYHTLTAVSMRKTYDATDNCHDTRLILTKTTVQNVMK